MGWGNESGLVQLKRDAARARRLTEENAQLRARLALIREWAYTKHGGIKCPAEIWPRLADALKEI